MRSFRFIALGAVLVCSLVASQVNATATVNVEYLSGSTAGAPSMGNVPANVNDLLVFSINVQVDSAGIAGIGFDLTWFATELNYSAATWETGTKFSSFTPTTSYVLLAPTAPYTPTRIGSDPTSRLISNLGWFGLPPNPTSTNIFLGEVTYEVTSTDETIIQSGFLVTDGSSATNAAADFITPNFTSFSINAPAPAATLSMLAGVATLALLSLRRRRD